VADTLAEFPGVRSRGSEAAPGKRWVKGIVTSARAPSSLAIPIASF
jgi:hypothetical protein